MKTRAVQSQACAVCDADQFHNWRWNGLEACGVCGHVRKSSALDRNNSERIQEAYFDADFAWHDNAFVRFHERLNAKRRARDLKRLRPTGRVLEVGVGHGNLLLSLQSAGYQVEGLDFCKIVAVAAQARYDLPVHCGTLETYAQAAPAGIYDAILMCHVLEHIESPLPALHAAHRLLKPGGILYLALPNRAAWNAYLPGWTGYEPYHIHYFGPGSLPRILSAANFHTLCEKTFEPISGWFNAAIRSVRRQSPDLEVSPPNLQVRIDRNGLVATVYNIIRIAIGILLSPLRWLQSALGYGEELILIAQAKPSGEMI